MSIEDIFQNYNLNDEGKAKLLRIQELFENIVTDLCDQNCSGTPEYIIAVRKLEEASFYFMRSMCSKADNQI